MTWLRNPFFASPTPKNTDNNSDVEAEAETEAEAANHDHHVDNASYIDIRAPSERLTAYQIFYIFILDGIGAFVLSGAINFAIAYAMYTTQNLDKHPIRLFQLPNTLAGDAAVTIIVQCIITWLIELILVNRDIKSGHVQPIGFIPEPENRVLRWYMFLDRKKELNEPGSVGHWAFFLFSQVLRAFIVAVISFCLLWGPCVGILTAVGTKRGGDWYFTAKWAPQIFKLLLGGILGLLTTPPFAVFWLVRAGWALRTNEGHSGD